MDALVGQEVDFLHALYKYLYFSFWVNSCVSPMAIILWLHVELVLI